MIRLAVALTAVLCACSQSGLPPSSPRAAPLEQADLAELQRRLASELPRLFADELSSLDPPGAAILAHLTSPSAPLREPAALQAIYGSRGAPLRFVDVVKGLSPAGARLQEVLEHVGDHGLSPSLYHVEQLRLALRALDENGPPPAAATLGAAELHRAREVLARARREAQPGRAAFAALIAEGSPVPEVARSFAEARRWRQARLRRITAVEVLLADGLLGLARDLSRGNTRAAELAAAATPGSQPAAGAASTTPAGGLAPAQREALIQARLRRDLSSVRDPSSLDGLIRELPPAHPQYRLLQGALRRYRELAAGGGWPALARLGRLSPKRSGRPEVKRLKERLAVEGWLEAPVDDRVDAALTKALVAYQGAHQLRPTGQVDPGTLSSLNVTAEQRLQAILLTLQRWRESATLELPYYFLVNVPDFHLEVWRRGQRLIRQRVVVGKNNPEKCDEETSRPVLAYATPLQAARLRTMVFSPYWNVTRTIRETELEPERGKDPEFYEKNGYEIMKPDTPGEWVRQLPGPQNPLGFVKFLFPNPYETYLHDTPEKGLFQRPVRAFSHGCIRVEDAWELARLTLTEDGQWDEARYGRLRRDWNSLDVEKLKKDFSEELYESWCKRAASLEATVVLRQPVPVLVEYYTVRVDDTGKVSFLADIYQLDRKRQSQQPDRPCVPESKLARQRFKELLLRLTRLEQRGGELASPLEQALRVVAKLDGSQSWEARRLVKRARKLVGFPGQVKNLAVLIRAEHAKLAESRGERRRSWGKRQIEAAVRVERLMTGLEKLIKEAEQVSAALQDAAQGR